MIYRYQDLYDDKSKLDHCGGKGRSLFLLKSNDIPVPTFVIIPFLDIRDEMKGLDPFIQDQLTKINIQDDRSIIRIAREIQDGIHGATFSSAFQYNLDKIVETVFGQNPYLAIRSSAYREDGPTDSFAGMFDSFLFVGKENILNKVKACIASSFNPRLIKYKLIKKIDLREYNMAVVLQEMIIAAKSGVLFTMNPEGNLNDSLICAAYGQGEGVVQGTADTISYLINRGTAKARIVQSRKRNGHQGSANAHFISNKNWKDSVLSQSELSQLFKSGKAIEVLFGGPQDIEFAINQYGGFQFLQSRDITTIRSNDLKILDNSNIVESYPGINLPLTFSFARSAYQWTMISTARCLNMTANQTREFENIFPELIAHVKGRIYYNLHHWYTIVQKTMTSEDNLSSWEDFIGVSKGEKRMKKLSLIKKLGKYVQFIWLYIRHQFNYKQFFISFACEYSKSRAFLSTSSARKLSAKEIFSFYEHVSERMFSFWGITLVNDIFVYRFFEQLKKLVSSFEVDECDNLANDLLCGIEGVESEVPIIKLLELKSKINTKPNLQRLFKAAPKVILDQLKNEKETSFAIQFFEYIELYGDRTLAELKLESPNFRTHPELLVRLLQEYLKNPLDVSSFKERQKQIRLKAELIFRSRQYTLSPGTWWFRYVLHETRKFIKNRENMRFARTRAFSVAKELFLQIGILMVQKGIIESQADIFFLQIEDLRAFCLDGSRKSLKSEIEKKKTLYESYGQVSLPDRIIYTGAHMPNLSDTTILHNKQNNCLSGIPISKGDMKGEALVLDCPDFSCKVDKKILVTRTTDPGWIFLMAQAKGLISEKGSPLSHTAIVGRELGIPTIVNVEGAMTNIKNGNNIHMHAQTGLIEILN